MQRILIIGNDTLIGAGTENLLRKQNTVDVYGIAAEPTSSLLLSIINIQPRIVIVDSHTSPLTADQLWQMFSQFGDLYLVEINAFTPYVRVFTKNQIWLTRLTGLVDAVDWLTNPNKSEFVFILKKEAHQL